MKKIILLVGIIMFYFPYIANGYEGLVPEINDARSTAMGRTQIVSANGSNAIFSNPAMLGTIEKNEIQAGGRLFGGFINNEYQEDAYDEYDDKYSIHPKLNHASLAVPFEYIIYRDFKIASFGVGYQTYYDLGFTRKSEWSDSTESQGSGGDPIIISSSEESTFDSSGGLNMLTLAGSIKYKDKYIVGLGFNKSIASSIKFEDTNKSVDNDTEFNYTEEVNAETSASFLTIGGLAELSPKLRIGLMYRSGFKWNWEDLEVEVDENDSASVTKLDDEEIKIPAIMGLGIAYKITPVVIIAGEYQTRSFSGYNTEKFNRAIVPEDMDDGSNMRLGIEFKGPTSFRLGFFSDAVPVTDSDDKAPISIIGYTAGFGHASDKMAMDTFIEYGNLSREYLASPPDGTGMKKFEDIQQLIRLGISISAYF